MLINEILNCAGPSGFLGESHHVTVDVTVVRFITADLHLSQRGNEALELHTANRHIKSAVELSVFVKLYLLLLLSLQYNPYNFLMMKLRLFAPGMRNANLSLLKQNMQIPFKWQVGEGLLTQLTFSVCVCVCVSVLYANTAVTDEV